MPKYHTRYAPPPSPHVRFALPSMVDVSQQPDCDINRIIDRYRETGYLVDPMHPGSRKPIFGDLTGLPSDYQAARQLIDDADEAFARLPSTVRERFANDPAEIFDFLADDKNYDEAVKLGLIAPDESVASGHPTRELKQQKIEKSEKSDEEKSSVG